MSDEILKHGSKGESVRKLQEDLNALGYAIAMDGIFGPKTEQSVKALQSAFGYTVDGLVGKGTRFLIDQQKGLHWRAGMPTAFTPPTAAPQAAPAPQAQPVPPAAAAPPPPAAAPAAKPVGKGDPGNKTLK
jgi:peptidoglycan hydrolase-like protein with peptidoglycan-binding domain